MNSVPIMSNARIPAAINYDVERGQPEKCDNLQAMRTDKAIIAEERGSTLNTRWASQFAALGLT